MDDRYKKFMGRGPKQAAHREQRSNPDAGIYLTTIDNYDQPRARRPRLQELNHQLPLPRPGLDGVEMAQRGG